MNTRKIQSVVILCMLTFCAYSIGANAKTTDSFEIPGEYTLSACIPSGVTTDFDPLCDVQVTFELQKIRSLERIKNQVHGEKKIDAIGKPDFYVMVTINDVEFTSPVWKNTQYLYDLNWTATVDVPDDEEFVTIRIQLWDWNLGRDKRCDISSFYDDKLILNYDVEIYYSITTGHWFGDDFVNAGTWLSDPSGYGRLNGCDDRSYYQKERDCELWFDVSQTDPDGDGIPYWTEVNVFGTDPEVDNTGEDGDFDGCPIEWEHKWGHQMWVDDDTNTTYHWWIYNPIEADPHETLDPDRDGLDNVEEYLTSQWNSDPFRKDLFIELDQMEEDPDGLMVRFTKNSKELLTTAYDWRNIVLHLDDGNLGGGEAIPFTQNTLTRNDLSKYYFQYFLHGNKNNWRIGVFHYALIVYDAGYAGYAFDNGHTDLSDSLQISSKYQVDHTIKNPLYNLLRRKTFDIQSQWEMVYAGVLMHETGHTLGIFHGNTPGCDDQKSSKPWQFNFWKYGPYQSVMNYRYVYSGLLDYSDGSRGRNDFNDWDTLDLTFFQN
jgi:hypothetical protein